MKKTIALFLALILGSASWALNFETNIITINPLGGAVLDANGVTLSAVGGVSTGQRVEIGLPSGVDANSATKLLIEITSTQRANGALMTQFLGGTSLNKNLSAICAIPGSYFPAGYTGPLSSGGMSLPWFTGAKYVVVYLSGIPAGASITIKSVQFLSGGVTYHRILK